MTRIYMYHAHKTAYVALRCRYEELFASECGIVAATAVLDSGEAIMAAVVVLVVIAMLKMHTISQMIYYTVWMCNCVCMIHMIAILLCVCVGLTYMYSRLQSAG